MNTTFYDMLGIDPTLADRSAPASALWPAGLVSLTKGVKVTGGSDALTIVQLLQTGLTFANVRPGVDPHAALGAGAAGQVAFAADMAISGLASWMPFYLHAMPDMGIQLDATDPLHPAQVFFAIDGRGHELIIDRLPVKIFLKESLASAIASPPVTVGTFDNTNIDSFAYTLDDELHPAEVDCFVRLHLTTEGDLILEPSVPISFGPVRWMGLPAKAVYDVQLLPSPNRRDYLEWTHNDIGSFFSKPPAAGALGFRSVELDFSQPPLSDLKKRVQGGAVHIDNLEIVLEDVVMPITTPGLPIPSHGTFGFRRLITDRSDIGQAYSLSGAPVQIPIYGSTQQGGNGGSSLTLQIERFLFRTGDVQAADPADQPQVQLQAALIFQTTSGATLGPTISVDDEWTLAAGMVMDLTTTPLKFTIADTTVGLVGFKFGVSVGRLAKGIPFSESFEALGDLAIAGQPATGNKVFAIQSLTGKPLSVVIRDLGWKLGHFSLDALQMPDGMQLVFANTVRIILEEMGWVEEPNGTPYFSFSGGVALGAGGGNQVSPSGSAGDNQGNGFGIRVRRLRFRLNEDATQPFLKLDGVFLKLKYGTVDIEGFGYISDYTDSGWAIKEWGFGVKIALSLVAMTFSIAAEFIKGNRKNLANPTTQYDYFLAALTLGFLPAGPVGLYDIRALVANNMAPNLDATFPNGEGMALLSWHQHHDNALTIPANRALADWLAELDAAALGVGCGFSLNGCGSALHLDIFIFFAKSKADTGLLIVGDLYLLKNPKPIAFVAIEYDIDKEKFGVMVGVDLTLADFASGAAPSWLASIARLTGTLYFANQPWQFAIGQLADQSTWLALRFEWSYWIEIKAMLGVCVQIVDGGPKGFGVVFTISGGADWGIGGFIMWGSFGLVIGTWKTGSDSSGLAFWIGLGFKINLFYVFSFGADLGIRMTYLGKHPWYITLHGEARIDTPWFMPDVTFSFDRTFREPLPFDTSTITQCLQSASALDPTSQSAQPLLTPALAGALGDASFVYTFNQLNGLTGTRISDTHLRNDLPIVSTDSTIVLNLSQPVSNDSLIATATYDGTTDSGLQTVQDISVRYGLKSIAVRRAPRFGATAGIWTDFVTDAQTQFSIGGAAPESLSFAWDVDTRADGKLSPKRLLINSASPYSFAVQGAQNDEQAAQNDPGYPCCDEKKQRAGFPEPHVLEFSKVSFGSRVPRSQEFSGENGAWWRWASPATPTCGPGDPFFPGKHVALSLVTTSELIGSVELADPAVVAQLQVSWESQPGHLYFEGYDGVILVAQQTIDMHAAGWTTLSLVATATSGRHLSRLLLRADVAKKEGPLTAAAAAPVATTLGAPAFAGIEILQISYVTYSDAKNYIAGVMTCRNGSLVGPPGSDASGKLAFLPNHDYEVVVTATIDVSTKDQGKRTLELSQALYFRTKGLPGLNACPNVGDDIRRHVETTYPHRRAIPLYRQEPCVLAFENSLSSILPIDRSPGAGTPPEKAQMFPLELNVDRVASLSGMKRLTVPSDDWIATHRQNPYPPIYVKSDTYAYAKVRHARSSDSLVLRYEAVKQGVGTCGAPDTIHASQVLLHEPIGANGDPGSWEPTTGYRATVRQKDGAFTERSGFDTYDLGAFINQADGAAVPTLWSVTSTGALVAPNPGGGRYYASCGELAWDHLKVHSQIDLATATAAGIAVGVGDGNTVPQAVIATVEPDGGGHALVVRRRDASGESELGRAAVTISGPFLLTVVAYDDIVRASVGDVAIDGSRGTVREGRVALVADGPAKFGGIAVGAIEIYSFEFTTSKFASFADHLGSFDGNLPTLAAGAFGGTPTPVGTVLASHGPAVPDLMVGSADPQARQQLFDAIVTELGLALRKDVTAVKLSRLTDASGATFGLLLESPEPISLTQDTSLTLTKHVRVWVPGTQPVGLPSDLHLTLQPPPLLPFGPGPIEEAATLAVQGHGPGPDPIGPEATMELTFGSTSVLAGSGLKFADGDQVARVTTGTSGPVVEVFAAPIPGKSGMGAGELRLRLTMDQAAAMPEFKKLSGLAPGSATVLRSGGILGPISLGYWEDADITIPVLLLSDGGERKILILSQAGSPLTTGDYTLHTILDRDRWQASSVADAEQHYHDEVAIHLTW